MNAYLDMAKTLSLTTKSVRSRMDTPLLLCKKCFAELVLNSLALICIFITFLNTLWSLDSDPFGHSAARKGDEKSSSDCLLVKIFPVLPHHFKVSFWESCLSATSSQDTTASCDRHNFVAKSYK